MKKLVLAGMIGLFTCLPSQLLKAQPATCGAVPSQRQLKWQEMEMYAFIHFSMNTFTDMEWGYGDKDPKLFNPTQLDCRQWARICKEAGFKGIILTTKHHDGFCLWPSKYTNYSVKASPWKDGKGDVIAELRKACDEYGLKLGLYLSPWDRNSAVYGSPEYITYFRNQLKEILTNYGNIFEMWFDGANGGTGYYGGANEQRTIDRKTYYDWPNTYKLVYSLQPNIMLFSDAGPDCRWCGTEEGWVGETNWSTLRRDEVWPGWPLYEQLRNGHEDGNYWVPAEVNTSIRPGWFYHASEDSKVKTPQQLVELYYNSIGRNGNMILNLPVDRRGLVNEIDEKSLLEFARIIRKELANDLAKGKMVTASNVREKSKSYAARNTVDGDNKTYWATDDGVTNATLTLAFKKNTTFNRVLLREYIALGQRVKAFTVDAYQNGSWKEVAKATTIGNKRILRIPSTTASKIRIHITDSKACPLISTLSVYNAPVEAQSNDNEKENLNVTKNWKIMNNDATSAAAIDGNPATVYIQQGNLPHELIIDLQKDAQISEFTYTPDKKVGAKGVIFNYRFSVSADGKNWETVSEGEFSNIKNNPIPQTKYFQKKKVRFVKLTALSNTDGTQEAGYAEIEVK
nr:alpha-L-fucosidase [uncultured Bacteroides sp.]